jgi:hypothetical protein
MPYAPTVNDRSGEIMMQGVLHGASALGAGLESAGRQWRKADEENTTAKSLFAATVAKNPELLKNLDEKSMKLIEKAKMGDTGRKENMYLAGVITSAQAQHEQAQAQRIRDMQEQEMKRAEEMRRREEQARMAAMAPVVGSRQRTPAEGLMVMRDPNVATSRQPNGEEAMLAYLKAGGSMRGAGDVGNVFDTMQRFGFNPQSGEGKLIQDAAALRKAGRNAEADSMLAMARKPGEPMPGSKGYEKRTLPGGGDIIVDLATGAPVSQGAINRADKPVKLTEAEVAFETNSAMALKGLQNLRKTVNEYGTYESEWLGNPKAAADLGQSAYQLAIQYAKIVDPASVAREGEVAAAQKYMIPLGKFASKKKALASMDAMENTIKGYVAERGKVRGGDGGAVPAEAAPKPSAPVIAPDGVRAFKDEAEMNAAISDGTFKPTGFVRIGDKKFRVTVD